MILKTGEGAKTVVREAPEKILQLPILLSDENKFHSPH